MKKFLLFIIIFELLSSSGMTEYYPALPENVVPTRISHDYSDFNLYIWTKPKSQEKNWEFAYMYIELLSDKAYFCYKQFFAVQDGEIFENVKILKYIDPTLSYWVCGDMYFQETTFGVDIYHDNQWIEFEPSKPFQLVFDYFDEVYRFDIVPQSSSPSPIVPTGGIWKSADTALSMYLQKYEAGSCVLVVTMGDGTYTAFLDEDYTDGIACSNDVDNHGHTLNLALTDSSHGTLTVTLPGYGEVVTPVELRFGDER